MWIGKQDLDKWIALLQGVKFFESFSEEELQHLLVAGEILHINLHEYIIKENDVDSSFFVILKGGVKLLKLGPMGQKKELGHLDAGSCFGEMGLLLNEKRTASVLAAEEIFIFKITGEAIETMPTETKANLYRQFSITLAGRLKNTTNSIINPAHY